MPTSRTEFLRFGCVWRALSCCVVVWGLGLGCEQSSHDASGVVSTPSVSSAGQDQPDHVSASRSPRAAAVEESRPTLVAFGDSLTAGLGVGPKASYPSLLQAALEAAGYRFRVINAGVSGDTTAGAVRRVDWVLKSRPRIVILEFGANDGLRGWPIHQTRMNLETIITRLQAAGVTVVLAGMQLPPNYGEDYTAQFAALYPELAHKYSLTLIPFFLEGVAGNPALNQVDGLHPTELGYRLVTETVMKYVSPIAAMQSGGTPSRTVPGRA